MAETLPVELTSFVGRRHELAEARRLLTTSRVLTMTGPGGVGKTRLAVQLARQVRRTWRDGVYFADLSAVDDPALLPHTVAGALGLPDTSTEPTDRLVAYLADKKAMLILDTCEHLVDSCAWLASRLIAEAPGVRLLTTSRHVLAIDGEQIFPVSPLPVSGAAVALFADRAATVIPDFVVDNSNRAQVGVICQMLDGIPLAIELAAARLRALSLDEIKARLDDRFRLLAGGSITSPNRQQTLAATLDWSFGLCSAKERTLWSRLSTFPGGCTLEAAEQVGAWDGVERHVLLDEISGLVDKSVLFRTDDRPVPRYRMLDTVRQYGQRKLAESGALAEVRARHYDYYIELARQCARHWSGPDQLTAYTKIRSEHANIRAVLEYSLSAADDKGLRLASYLNFYWLCCGAHEEGRRWLTRALQRCPAQTRLKATALWSLGLIMVLQGNVTESADVLDECEAIARCSDDQRTLAFAAFARAFGAFTTDDPAAVPLLHHTIERLDNAGLFTSLTMTVRACIAMELAMQGEYSEATSIARTALATCERQGEKWSRSYACYALALAEWGQGEFQQAVVHAKLGLELAQVFNDIASASLLLELLAWIAASDGGHERSAQLFGAASRVWTLVGDNSLLGSRKWMRRHDEMIAQARTVLGERDYAAGMRAGAMQSPDAEHAIQFALDKKPDQGCRPATAQASPLTNREQQVAGLVATGLTSREVAAQLGISPHTAEVHVNRILAKLGFTSRTLLAAWVAEQADE